MQHHTVRAIAQDRTGYLWVGTATGMYRFDGVRFTRVNDGLVDDQSREMIVRAVSSAPDGTLWVATNHGLFYLAQGRFRRSTLPAAARVSNQSSLASDSDGRLYVATTEGVFLSEPASPQSRQFARHPGVPGAASGIWVDRPLRFWTGSGTSIYSVDGLAATAWGAAKGVPPASYSSFARDNAGTLWARERGGLLAMPLQSAMFQPVAGVPRSKVVDGLAIDPRGNVVVPTQFGLYFRRDNTWVRVSTQEGLPDNPVCCVIWDREGTPWIGLESYGVAQWLGSGEWTYITETEGLSNNSVTAIARAGGRLWIGTESGLNVRGFDGVWRQFLPGAEFGSEWIRGLTAASDGGLWVALASGGLRRVDTLSGAVQIIGTGAGLPNAAVVTMVPDADGTLWVSTRDGVFRADPRRYPLQFVRDQPEGGQTVYRIRRTTDGRLWMSGTGGLFYRNGDQWRKIDLDGKAQSGGLVFFTERVPGELWLGYGKPFGVSRVKIDDLAAGKLQVDHFRAPAPLPSDEISFVEADRRGWLWAGTDQGVAVYDGESWHQLGTFSGLVWPDTVYDAFHDDDEGAVWIGTHRGLARFMPPRRFERAMAPVSLSGVWLSGRQVDSASEGAIESGERSFRTAFAAMTFKGADQIRYRYRLIGWNDVWVETNQREAMFPNLGPGRYTFEVQARVPGSENWGQWPARYTFVIAPGIWETQWFRLYLLALSVLLGWLWWKQRERRLRRVHAELEEAVLVRTRELEAEKRRAEKALEEAREASRLKSEFLANVSHEIRTPMNGVLGMAALALETPLSAEQREYIETIRSAGGSLLQLLNDILDFSKIEAGRLEIETTPFSLRDIVDGALRTIQFTAKEKGLAVEMHIFDGVPELVVGDPVRLRQVLVNLLSNAVKFTSSGRVALAVRPAEGSQIEFAVSDTGIGIPAEKLWLIFDPFRQADGSTTRKYGGTGLGLAICRRLVTLMGGEIGVESEPGRGSVFRFTIQPAAAPAEIAAPEPDISKPRRPLRILLVDDNRVSRLIAERLLEKRGHSVVSAEGGREALGRFEPGSFDAVIMDMQMPDIDGLEATRRIRQWEHGSEHHTPVVMVTANAMESDRLRAIEAGADVHLSKPVQPRVLFAAVERLAGEAEVKR